MSEPLRITVHPLTDGNGGEGRLRENLTSFVGIALVLLGALAVYKMGVK